MVDLYQALDISKNASREEIKRAFRDLSLRYHPDRNPGDEAAEERFKEVAGAYGILSDPAKRAAYDLENRSPRDSSLSPEQSVTLENLAQLFLAQLLKHSIPSDFLNFYAEYLERTKNLAFSKEVRTRQREQVEEAKTRANKRIADGDDNAVRIIKEAETWAEHHRRQTQAKATAHVEQARKKGSFLILTRAKQAAEAYRIQENRKANLYVVKQRARAQTVRRQAQHQARSHVSEHRALARKRAYEETSLRLAPKERQELDRRVRTAVRRQQERRRKAQRQVTAIIQWRSENSRLVLILSMVAGGLVPIVPYPGYLFLSLLCAVAFLLFPGLFLYVLQFARITLEGLVPRKALSNAGPSETD